MPMSDEDESVYLRRRYITKCKSCGETLTRSYECRLCNTEQRVRCFNCHCEVDHDKIFPPGRGNLPVQMGRASVVICRGGGRKSRNGRPSMPTQGKFDVDPE